MRSSSPDWYAHHWPHRDWAGCWLWQPGNKLLCSLSAHIYCSCHVKSGGIDAWPFHVPPRPWWIMRLAGITTSSRGKPIVCGETSTHTASPLMAPSTGCSCPSCCAGCSCLPFGDGASKIEGSSEQHAPAGHLIRHPAGPARELCSPEPWPLPVASVSCNSR